MSKQQQQQPTCVYDAIREMHKGISGLQNALQALTELVGAPVAEAVEEANVAEAVEEADVNSMLHDAWRTTLVGAPVAEAVEPTTIAAPETTVWNNAPAWAKWAAMDESKMWYYYSHEPITTWLGNWCIVKSGSGVKKAAFNAPPAADWCTSLTRRPVSARAATTKGEAK